MIEYGQQEQDRVILVGLDTGEEKEFEHSMEELKSLAEACNKKVVGIITQRAPEIHKAFYIGVGKVEEVKEFARTQEATEVVFDNALSPSQIRNLVKELDLAVSDRTNLILDIFATRAQTREAKLQVETARLKYMLPRLVGMRESLGRQGGASGSMSNKGVGEKKLELDRRKIEHRISELEKELSNIASNRMTQRKRRDASNIPQVALVGYTNAGKSTLLNHMVDLFCKREEKKVLEKDMLFATLETNVRYIETGNHKPFYLADTVGFINKLPHSLVKAFHSTLEEVLYADLLLHVVDFSDENYKQHMAVAADTLRELGAGDIPQIVVYNKADLCGVTDFPVVKEGDSFASGNSDAGNPVIYLSARDEQSVRGLVRLIQQIIYAKNIDCTLRIPYDRGDIVDYFNRYATVEGREYREDGIVMQVNCREQDASKFEMYLLRDDT